MIGRMMRCRRIRKLRMIREFRHTHSSDYMKDPMTTNWTESDFEKSFSKNPVLPGGEVLLVISRHQPIKRVVDILCLDANGGLVIIEVKNEKATRTVVGQALEYLSQYEDADMGTVEEDFNVEIEEEKTIGDLFREKFKKPLPAALSPARRVLIIAPNFDFPTAVAIEFLSGSFKSPNISFALLRASMNGEEFTLDLAQQINKQRVKDLQGQFALTYRGRPLFVLPEPYSPLCWTLGKLNPDNSLHLLGTAASTHNSIRTRKDKYLIPVSISDRPDVDVSGLGNGWRHKKRTNETAIEIGVIKGAVRGEKQREYHVSIRLKDDVFVKFRRTDPKKFKRDWEPATFETEPHIKALTNHSRAVPIR